MTQTHVIKAETTGVEKPVVNADQKPQDQKVAADNSRPEWLPDNFKDGAQLAESYKLLQAEFTKLKQGGSQQEAPKQEAPKPEDKKPDEQKSEDKKEGDGKKPDENKSEVDKVTDDLKSKGIDVDAMSKRFWEKGEIVEDDRKVLLEGLKSTFGSEEIANKMLDNFAQSQVLAKKYIDSVVHAPWGGEDKAAPILEWAKSSLDKSQAEAINSMWDSGDVEKMGKASQLLHTLYKAANGSEPKTVITGNTTANSQDVYTHQDQITRDMSDKRYKTDASFRDAVAAKIARSGL